MEKSFHWMSCIGFLQCEFVMLHIVENKNTLSRNSQQCNRGRITVISLLSSNFLAFHTYGVNRHIVFPNFNTTDWSNLSYLQWCLSDSSWQLFCSLGDHTISSFMTSQSALWRPCCIVTVTFHAMPMRFNQKDASHSESSWIKIMNCLEKYAFNQTT